MKHFPVLLFVVAGACAPAAMAQKWEVGVGIGGAFYNSQTFTNAIGNADASLSNGPVISAWLGNNSGKFFGGELRFDFESTGLKLSSGGTNATFGAQTDAIHYDFVMHFTTREARIRPFVAAGGGIKLYRGTGKEVVVQPLSGIALLTKTSEVKALLSVGGGVKINLTRLLQLRLEVHDYMTPFPAKVIAPNLGSKVGGWLMDFVPMGALALTF